MCKLCAGQNPNRILLSRQPPSVEEAISALAAAFADVLAEWHAGVTAELEDGALTLSSPEAVIDELRRILEQYREDWTLAIEDMWVDGAELGREAQVRRHSLDTSYDITRDAVYRALQENGAEAADLVQGRVVEDLGQSLADAYDEGQSIDEITQTLQDEVIPEYEGYQARRVARTETIAGSNEGAQSAYQDAPGVTGKTWLATDDSRTRVSHRKVDHVTEPVDGMFIVGGERAAYPGDMSLSVGERANCRCSIIPSLG